MKRIIYILLTIFLIGCNLEDEEFVSERENNKSNTLRLDGYYYISDYGRDTIHEEYKNIIFLYRNGVLFDLKLQKIGNSFEHEKEALIDTSNINRIKRDKSCWGIYKLNNDTILIEEWVGIPAQKVVYFEEGKVLNDTTFIITKSMARDSSDIYTRNIVFSFRQFSPKPDSTNSFIE